MLHDCRPNLTADLRRCSQGPTTSTQNTGPRARSEVVCKRVVGTAAAACRGCERHGQSKMRTPSSDESRESSGGGVQMRAAYGPACESRMAAQAESK